MGFVQICRGHYYWLEPQNAFQPWQEPEIGLVALAFLQGSFAYGGWNFLNYVTEELVDPYRCGADKPKVLIGNRGPGYYGHDRKLAQGGTRLAAECARLQEAVGSHVLDHAHLRGAVYLRRGKRIPLHLLTCASTLLMLVTSDIYTLINYVGFINYLFYGVTIAGQIVLRWKQPDIPRPIKVNLIFPVVYLLFWAFLLIFSLWSEPVVCGIGLAIMLTGVPVYFLGVYWRNKPKCFDDVVDSITYFGQKLCVVVYPEVAQAKSEQELQELTSTVCDNTKE
ncbi:large neutral amino acids transporter small subunit 2-like [Chiloscyllium plagiosum]|uniref:large neutral amino acids transporter small subunit 2-like n=1 Tax=Chiloscyllium plagiosum TaxID=36176 RepID=UPI001CB7DD84|nr:large neutral amino acids transporter small subunit 2-like [Chiloscyllium plagiosum]